MKKGSTKAWSTLMNTKSSGLRSCIHVHEKKNSGDGTVLFFRRLRSPAFMREPDTDKDIKSETF